MKERTSQTIAQLNLHTRLSSASIADVRETGPLKSRTFMRPHTKSVLLKHLTQAPQSRCITPSKKQNFLVAVFPVDGDYAFCARKERETNGFVKPRASDV